MLDDDNDGVVFLDVIGILVDIIDVDDDDDIDAPVDFLEYLYLGTQLLVDMM